MKRYLFLMFMIVVGVIFSSITVQSATIHVTTTQDNVVGSLRYAINTANNSSTDTTIYLPAGQYLLSGTVAEDINAGGDLDIDTNRTVKIIGASKETTIINGDLKDRVLHILSGKVAISEVTIMKGKTKTGTVGNGNGEPGAGIYNWGELTLENCIICDNSTGAGYDCSSNANQSGGNGGNGGGIANYGTLTLKYCIVEDNFTGKGGEASSFQPYNICCINAGDGGDGGGLYNAGNLSLTESTILNNATGNGGDSAFICGSSAETGDGGKGGGIFNSGTLWATRCNIGYNTTGSAVYSGSDNGRGGDGGFGGGVFSSGTLTLINSTIHHNITGSGNWGDFYEMGEGGHGGGVFNSANNSRIINCTISSNTTSDYPEYRSDNVTATDSCGTGSGGGIYNKGQNLLVKSTTICRNKVGKPASGFSGAFGGGIYNDSTGSVKLLNTLVADNQVSSSLSGPDCYGVFESLGFNLIEDTQQYTITGITNTNITGRDPWLSPVLADNGGPTLTHELHPNSVAIDAGNSEDIPGDQRGHDRPVDIPGIINAGDGSDIGAYEFDRTQSISGWITSNGTGLAGVTLTFSNNAGTTTSGSNGFYSHRVLYNWSGTITPSLTGYTFTPESRSYSQVSTNLPNQNFSTGTTGTPRLSLNRSQLNFGTNTSGSQTPVQTFLISNSGSGILNWNVSDNASWLICGPTAGTGPAVVTVSITPAGLSTGNYNGTITVTAPTAENSPQTIQVLLTVYDAGSGNLPFGNFDTPLDGSTVSGSVPVTGWAVDNIGVESVKIYRAPVTGEGSQWIYIGNTLRVEGARPDIETLFPDYPESYKAGWGYMMLTNFLPNQGNGTFILYAQAADKEGNVVTLGSKTIYCDNAHAVKPFGAIDNPAPGSAASGAAYLNSGWALTPLPNTIPTDGSTIQVWVDGISLGHPVYNQYREDVATLFPGYNNSYGALGYYYLDTTGYENGLHTIFWTVTDNAGNSDGIGSRFFSIQNLSGSTAREAGNKENTCRVIKSFDQTFSKGGWHPQPIRPPAGPPEAAAPLRIQKGYNSESGFENLYPDENGHIVIEIKELERLVIYLEEHEVEGNVYQGFLVNGNDLKPLPIGSTFDGERGVFYWQPGPAFLGTYRLVFIAAGPEGISTWKDVQVTITSKFPK